MTSSDGDVGIYKGLVFAQRRRGGGAPSLQTGLRTEGLCDW